MKNKLTENQIAIRAILLIGLRPGVTTSELITYLEETFLPLHPDDKAILKNRKDSHFSQKVRNLNSHYNTNFFGRHTNKLGKRDGSTTWTLNSKGSYFFRILINKMLKASASLIDDISIKLKDGENIESIMDI